MSTKLRAHHEYDRVVTPIFQRAIDITKTLLSNNNLSGDDLKTILMIGGPTFSNTLRNLIKEQITPNVNISIDPMIAVARGAALFASTKDIPENIRKIDKTKIQLQLKYPETTVETNETFGIRINRQETDGDIPERLFVEVTRHDKSWSSGKVEITDDAEILTLKLADGKPNGFQLVITDNKGTAYPTEPDSFSIIQGFKVAGTTLAWDLCIDAYELSEGRQHLVLLKGLKKNQPLPAKGSGIFQTQKDIRPGNDQDTIRIPIYEGEEGTKAPYNKWRGEVLISGDDLPSFLPKGSEVEVSVEVDGSEMVKVAVSFPYLDDETIEDTLQAHTQNTPEKEAIKRDHKKVLLLLETIEDEFPDLDATQVERIRNNLNEVDSLLVKGGSESDTRFKAYDQICEIAREVDELQSAGEWPRLEQELNESLDNLKDRDEQYGDDNSSKVVEQLSGQVKIVIERKNIKMARNLIDQIGGISFAIVDKAVGVAMEISVIKGFDDDFDMHEWKDRSQARKLVDEAKTIISTNRATKSNLRPIVVNLYSMLPNVDQKIIKPDDDVLVK